MILKAIKKLFLKNKKIKLIRVWTLSTFQMHTLIICMFLMMLNSLSFFKLNARILNMKETLKKEQGKLNIFVIALSLTFLYVFLIPLRLFRSMAKREKSFLNEI